MWGQYYVMCMVSKETSFKLLYELLIKFTTDSLQIRDTFIPGESGGLGSIGLGMPRNVAPSFGLVRFHNSLYSSGPNRLDNVTQ